jgi:hypothetical protein
MRHRLLTPLGVAAAMVAVMGAVSNPGPTVNFIAIAEAASGESAQIQTAAAKTNTARKTTRWGDPDLQGVYNVISLTPLERPKQFADREFLTEEEVAEIEKRASEGVEREVVVEQGDTGFYNRFWRDPGREARPRVIPTRRTSLIIDPPDGRLPPLTPQAQKIRQKISEILKRDGPMVFNRVGPSRLAREGSSYADSYLDRDSTERCIGGGLPTIAGSLVGNNGVQIVQGPRFVVINYESRATRVIPLDGQPHLPPNVRQWMGDARGHWEGQTLVVDTTNFTDEQGYQGGFPQGNLHLTERFTRVDDHTLSYEATIDDPAIFVKPWTVAFPWLQDDQYVIYEVACHEGNDSLTNILSGARAQEGAK